MRFLTFIIKNLVRRPMRSCLTLLGVALAVGAVVALVGISRGFVDSFVHLYDERGVDLVVVRSGVTERLTSALDEKLGAQIRDVPGVKYVSGALMDVVSFPDLNLFGVPIMGWKSDSFLFDKLKIVSGRQFNDQDGRVVMLGDVLAKNLGKSTGDTLDVMEDEPFHVVGVFQSFSVLENASMIVSLGELQRLMDRPGRVNAFDVIADSAEDKAAINGLREKIEGLAPGLSVMSTHDFVTSNTQIRLARAMAWMTSIIALVIGSVGVLNTMVMSVFERTQEIGILRAIGWRKSRIMRMILMESVLLSLTGAAVGTLGALAVTRFLSRLPSSSGMISGDISLPVIGQGLLIALVLGLLGGGYPALHGAHLQPTEAIRHE